MPEENNIKQDFEERKEIYTKAEIYIEEIRESISNYAFDIKTIAENSHNTIIRTISNELEELSIDFNNIYTELLDYNNLLEKQIIKFNEEKEEISNEFTKEIEEATEELKGR